MSYSRPSPNVFRADASGELVGARDAGDLPGLAECSAEKSSNGAFALIDSEVHAAAAGRAG